MLRVSAFQSGQPSMKYGYFDEKNREYVITRPDTPRPWVNFLGTDDKYCAMVSHTGGGFSYHIDPKDKRILRYRFNGLPMDRPGRYIYLRDNQSCEFWSATWQPVAKDLSEYAYTCRHGMGYTRIESRYCEIEMETTYFVPCGQDFEIWFETVRNTGARSRQLTLFSYAEFSHWNALKDWYNLQATLNTAYVSYRDGTIYHSSYTDPSDSQTDLKFDRYTAFFTSSVRSNGFDVQREAFIGPWRDESRPLAVEQGSCTNLECNGGNPVAAMQFDLSLAPGEETTLVFALGVAENEGSEKQCVGPFLDFAFAKRELDKVKSFWVDYVGAFQANVPDMELGAMINTWNPYQAKSDADKWVSLTYTGVSKGVGFRDCLQRGMGVCHSDAKRLREMIRRMASIQYAEGNCRHSYFPLSGQSEGDGFSDDPAWLVLAVADYLRETGDMGFLRENIPFLNASVESLYEHLSAACAYMFGHCGKHGLPLIGVADWNDCLNFSGPAESQMVACHFVLAANELAEIARRTGRDADADRFASWALTMKGSVNACSDDLEWYPRAFDGSGAPVGCSHTDENRIFLNAQTWAVISGIADAERGCRVMDAARDRLLTRYGLLLLDPPYCEYDLATGSIGVVPPGFKENGGIFCHANTWAVIAECVLGRGDRAFEYHQAYAPQTKNEMADVYHAEPYAYAQAMAGKGHPLFGSVNNSWQTGTTPWALIGLTRYVLGIRADYDGLLVNPCIPSQWDRFEVRRRFRNAGYQITVQNPKHLCSGVESITVDGSPISSQLLPAFADGATHHVTVELG